MEEDLIVVDDIDAEAQPDTPLPLNGTSSSQHSLPQRTLPERASTSRLRSGSTMYNLSGETSERPMRSSTMRPKVQPKLKLKLSEKAAAQAPGMSFLGPYDRELDSDDEELAFEEQFILRIPPGEDLEKLRKMVQSREISNDVWFKFKDSRRAAFHIGSNTYSAKLVDLPCIVESQKTLDNKQMFKVADICQMLVVENKIENDEQVGAQRNFNIDEFIWPHGVTPPLHHVRKRRFRKRVNRRTIESVEEQVERLLDEDALASEVKYEVLDNVNPDLSDSEFIEREEPLDAPTPAISDLGDAATPREDMGEGEEDEEGDEDEMEANPLIRKRFEDALKKLTADLEMKQAQRDELKEKQRLKKEGITINGGDDTDPEMAGDQDAGADAEEEDDLFGPDDPSAMEIG
ncbi:Transcription initiation factor TFIID subunit 7 [Leucoagaricus sp. SymC.cos]|nr:Transcription initiation factor TFIID subunit 7 [Leucoagaricus sp. SymC.cos]